MAGSFGSICFRFVPTVYIMRRFKNVSSINEKDPPGETFRKRCLLYTGSAGDGKGLYQKGENMFNNYYAKQEQYKDLLKEAEKERLLKQLKRAEEATNKKPNHNEDWSWSSWFFKLSQSFKESKLLSS
jgi:hypothetical protein